MFIFNEMHYVPNLLSLCILSMYSNMENTFGYRKVCFVELYIKKIYMKLSYISLKNVNFLVQHDQNTNQHILQTFIFTFSSSNKFWGLNGKIMSIFLPNEGRH